MGSEIDPGVEIRWDLQVETNRSRMRRQARVEEKQRVLSACRWSSSPLHQRSDLQNGYIASGEEVNDGRGSTTRDLPRSGKDWPAAEAGGSRQWRATVPVPGRMKPMAGHERVRDGLGPRGEKLMRLAGGLDDGMMPGGPDAGPAGLTSAAAYPGPAHRRPWHRRAHRHGLLVLAAQTRLGGVHPPPRRRDQRKERL